MSNELKVGDKVTIDGDEFEIMHSIQAPWLQKVPQKSELDKFVQRAILSHEFSKKSAEIALQESALALLEYLERRAEEFNHSIGMKRAVTMIREWCGK